MPKSGKQLNVVIIVKNVNNTYNLLQIFYGVTFD